MQKENICKKFAELMNDLRKKKDMFDVFAEELKIYDGDKPKVDVERYNKYKKARDSVKNGIREIGEMLFADKRFWDWEVGERKVFGLETVKNQGRELNEVVFRSDGERCSIVVKKIDGEHIGGEVEDNWILDSKNFGENVDGTYVKDNSDIFFDMHYPKMGKDIIFSRCYGDKNILVKNGEEVGEKHDFIRSVHTNIDGSKIVAISSERDGQFGQKDERVIINDSYLNSVYSKFVIVSIDDAGENVIFVAKDSDKKNCIVTRNLESGNAEQKNLDLKGFLFDNVYQVVLSPDGKNFAAVIGEQQDPGGSDIELGVIFNGKLVVRGVEGIQDLVFSPDGKMITFCGKKRDVNRKTMWQNYVVDEYGFVKNKYDFWKKTIPKSLVEPHSKPVWSDDGRCIAFSLDFDLGAGGSFVVLNGNTQKNRETGFSSISNIEFSPDGARIMFVGKKDGDYFRVVNNVSDWLE